MSGSGQTGRPDDHPGTEYPACGHETPNPPAPPRLAGRSDRSQLPAGDDLDRSLPETTVPTREEHRRADAVAAGQRVRWHTLRTVSKAHQAVRDMVDP